MQKVKATAPEGMDQFTILRASFHICVSLCLLCGLCDNVFNTKLTKGEDTKDTEKCKPSDNADHFISLYISYMDIVI